MASETTSSPFEVSSHSDQTSAPQNSRHFGNSGNSENLSPLITSHKLNGQNFLQWSQSVRMFICGRGKEDYLTGEIPILKKDDPGYKKWKVENHQIMSWLVNSMNVDIGENFLLYETAQEIWEAVRETYSSSENTSELFAIESILHDLRQGDLAVTQYFNTLTRHWQQLDMFESHGWKCPEDNILYRKIVEQKRTFKFLLGLNKNLDEVRGRVMGTKPLLSLREGFFEVRREESRKKVMMGGQHSSPTLEGSAGSALAARGLRPQNQHDSRQQRKGRAWCDHCAKPGHTKDTCWKIHGKPADWKPSKPGFDRDSRAHSATTAEEKPATAKSSPFTKGQLDALQRILSNTLSQHVAPTPSASMHAQASNSQSASFVYAKHSRYWIIDSGASDHMTGDGSLFHEYQLSHTNLTVRIADGSLSKVAGIGSIWLSPEIILKSMLHELGSRKKIGSAEMCSGLYLSKRLNLEKL
ncbi:uncharacterized protein LOC112094389 [Morus notabilis]|uniref:uncharacterized protein LOC112094389 n=1 Tax=Morus notabilis TaxID=981085 RepID=UPI000CED07A9|nr:uncharacterized protein LOC112094389 [Morus notabilis]